MNDVYVIGVGMTRFGKHPQASLADLGREACLAALSDAGVAPSAVQAGYCGTAMAALVQKETGVGQSVLAEVGIRRLPVVNVENACASGSTALHEAWKAVAAGYAEIAVVVGVDKAVMPKGAPLAVGGADLETQLGDIFPGTFALVAQKHTERYGTTREQMAQVAVKSHAAGALNPWAHFQQTVSLQEVLSSPMIAAPLTLFSCCPNSDGAAAVVLARGAAATARAGRRIRIAASTLTTGGYENDRDLTRWQSEADAARQAYEVAGLGPADLDVVEVHDAFTICEIVHYEGLGLCRAGEGGRLVEEGITALGGRQPVNPSGGLLSRGHPPGASGVAQVVELAWQLRGEAGQRQVEGARVGLAQIMGGSKDGDARACTVHILVAD